MMEKKKEISRQSMIYTVSSWIFRFKRENLPSVFIHLFIFACGYQ